MRVKPTLKYTEMCIYIDKHIYTNDYDPNLVFDYLKYLFYALASKKRFFKCEEDYDGYCIYGATQAFLRLTNAKQFLPDDDPKKMPKIKSILNFIKKILYPCKVNYQQEHFSQISNVDSEIAGGGEEVRDYFTTRIESANEPFKTVDVETYLQSIPKTLYSFLQESPYAKNATMLSNLYTSCLITLLRNVTLSNYNESRLKNRNNEYRLNVDNLLQDMYYEESSNAPVV